MPEALGLQTKSCVKQSSFPSHRSRSSDPFLMSTGAQSKNEAPVLRAENLGRSVRDKILVADASFEVHKGETMVIVGPSGSGKSSLLRLLNRLDEPTTGTVYLDGVDYRQIAPRELRRRVGMVTQRPFLFPGRSPTTCASGPGSAGKILPKRRSNSCSRALAWQATAREMWRISPEAKPSGSRLRGRLRTPLKSFSSMNRPQLWTTIRSVASKYWSRRLGENKALRAYW